MQASQNKYGPAIVKLNTARSIPQFCRSRWSSMNMSIQKQKNYISKWVCNSYNCVKNKFSRMVDKNSIWTWAVVTVTVEVGGVESAPLKAELAMLRQ
jgi:hypothetical protein